jgi:uncharacterized protein (DUF433 family)
MNRKRVRSPDKRITAEHILRCLAAGESEAEIVADYPPLTIDGIRVVQAYAADDSLIVAAPLEGKTSGPFRFRRIPRQQGLCGYIIAHKAAGHEVMKEFDRITQNPAVMGGKPCIRGMRVTVGMIVGQISAGHTIDDLLASYPYLEREDIVQALRYAAWRASEREIVLAEA